MRPRAMPRAGRLAAALPALALLLLSTPGAAAAVEQTRGELRVDGDVVFDGPTASTLTDVYGLVAPEITARSRLSLQAAAMELCHVGKAFLVARLAEEVRAENPSGNTRDCRRFTNAMVETTPGRDPWGYVGVYPDAMRATFGSEEILAAEPRLASRLASEEARRSSAEADREESIVYALGVETPHVHVHAPGRLDSALSGLVKVRGLDLLVSSDEGSFRYRTGLEESAGPVPERKVTYALLRVVDARLALESAAPVDVLARTLETTLSEGEVRFSSARGSIESADAKYEPRPGLRDHVGGSFTTALWYEARSASGVLVVEGALAATSLRRVPAPTSPSGPAPLDWLPVAPLAFGAVAVAGGALLHALRGRVYLRLAHRADTLQGRLRWVERACEADPKDHDAAMWMAHLHRAMGHRRGARALMERAIRLAPPSEGRPDYYLAGLILEAAGEADDPDVARQEAIVHLERALSRSPALFLEVQADRLFQDLRGPELEAMLRDARQRAAVVRAS